MLIATGAARRSAADRRGVRRGAAALRSGQSSRGGRTELAASARDHVALMSPSRAFMVGRYNHLPTSSASSSATSSKMPQDVLNPRL